MNILIVSTAVGPVGQGIAGGVDITLNSIIEALLLQDHSVGLIVPEGSNVDVTRLYQVLYIPGIPQQPCQHQDRRTILEEPENGLLKNMWEKAAEVQNNFDKIINLGYDALPLKLTFSFTAPIFHLISMQSISDAMDKLVRDIASHYPERLAFHTHYQAQTFKLSNQPKIIYNGFNIENYKVWSNPENALGWIGRISPEKGLEDAVSVAKTLNIKLKIWGYEENSEYKKYITQHAPADLLDWQGFLPHDQLCKEMGNCCVLLMTPKWEEALGNCSIEAAAAGVPVVSYAVGGIPEIIKDGVTGYLVTANNIEAMADAVTKALNLNKLRCRDEAAKRFSISQLSQHISNWLELNIHATS
jgi:UDP-glucose:tetrahydrobiopterin glucosyltransferase